MTLSDFTSIPLGNAYADTFQSPTKENDSLIKTQLLSRGASFGVACVAFTASTADTLIGVILGVGSILIGGTSSALYKKHCVFIDQSKYLLSSPFTGVLLTINPNADIKNEKRDGLISELIVDLFARGNLFRCSENIFMRHVVSRLNYAAMGISLTLSRIADAALSLIAVPLSIITLGKVEQINDAAIRTLQFTAVVRDLFYCTSKIINPWAGSSNDNAEGLTFAQHQALKGL
jgi:hypothetical protein